jgi:hypothetical protein
MRLKRVDSFGELGVSLRCYQGGILTVCSTGDQTKTLDPGLRRDDAGNFIVSTTTSVLPAQPGPSVFACMPEAPTTEAPNHHTPEIFAPQNSPHEQLRSSQRKAGIHGLSLFA